MKQDKLWRSCLDRAHVCANEQSSTLLLHCILILLHCIGGLEDTSQIPKKHADQWTSGLWQTAQYEIKMEQLHISVISKSFLTISDT